MTFIHEYIKTFPKFIQALLLNINNIFIGIVVVHFSELSMITIHLLHSPTHFPHVLSPSFLSSFFSALAIALMFNVFYSFSQILIYTQCDSHI